AEQAALFEELRAVRRHLAAGKPAYTVLSDATLRDIAVRRPASLDQLAGVKGVGPAKLQQYGAAFLAAVAGDG
ncbi:MAG: HRDC domain-containing protein, partial [Actinomycetota bacterium]